jgi:hypothetical protein
MKPGNPPLVIAMDAMMCRKVPIPPEKSGR